jgi:uncharacterized membrane protein YeaQ/YmgE (transglycosylase-associated protein family)
MGIIICAVLGLIAGFIGGKIIDKQGQGFPLNIALGVAGAFTGGVLFDLFGASGVAASDVWGTIGAIMNSRALCC